MQTAAPGSEREPSSPSPEAARRRAPARRLSRLANLALGPLIALGWLCSRLGLSAAQRLGRALGWVWYHVVPIRRATALANVAVAFPDMAGRERARIAERAFSHVATSVLELLWASWQRPEQLQEVVDVEGLEEYEAVRRSGRGAIAVTAHLGSFDLLACAQAASGVPLHVVTKDLSSGGLDGHWKRTRAAFGVRMIPATGSVRTIVEALRRGEVVGMVVDQRTPASEGGELIPFFGHDAWTTVAPPVLAKRARAALLPVVTFRRADGTHAVRVGEEIPLQGTPRETMAEVHRLLEEWIREHPGQWLWQHRRWAR